MSYRQAHLSDWSADATRAVTENPGYFMRWYTLKSLGLVAAIAVATYYVGKDVGRRQR